MTSLNLTQEERDVLIKTLDVALTELQMEISNTENWEFKAGLKNDKKAITRVLEALRSS